MENLLKKGLNLFKVKISIMNFTQSSQSTYNLTKNAKTTVSNSTVKMTILIKKLPATNGGEQMIISKSADYCLTKVRTDVPKPEREIA